MPKSKKKTAGISIRPKMLAHVRALGLTSIDQYLMWCQENGFHRSIDKSPADRANEIEIFRRLAKRAKERQQIHHNPRKFLQRVCFGEIELDNIDRPGWHEVGAAIAASNAERTYRQSLFDFLLQLERKSGMLFESVSCGRRTLRYIDGLIHLHDRKGQWIRNPEDWRPASHNVQRQFASLARFLTARFPVPDFMDSAWMRTDTGSHSYRDWFIHIGVGKNIRTAKLRFSMTSRMAHHFLQAPGHYSIEGALLWGEIHALGGKRHLTEAILGTRLGDRLETDPDRRAFWTSVFHFFIENPMLDRCHVGPIVDYLNSQKFEEQEVVVERGRVERRPPPRPNLSMNRRTPESLLREVERWHGDLRVFAGADKRYFRPSGYPGLTLEKGPADDSGARAQWRIRELLSGNELMEEGRRMQHCVASYAGSCARGHCSIWTMERQQPGGKLQKHLTLELGSDGTVLQARGRLNRLPTDQERAVLDVWVERAGLSKSPWF